MKWRGLGLLVFALAALPLFAGTASATSFTHTWTSSEQMQAAFARARPTRAHTPSSAPIRRIGHARPGLGGMFGGAQVTSGNWAGYDVTGGGFTSVSATWTQPSVQPNYSIDTASSFWVGLDGDGSSTVEQCGTEADSTGGVVSYDAWYEMYPDYEVPIDGMTISPGDVMTGTVTTDGAGDFTMTISDDTTGHSYETDQYSDSAQDYSAEVIAEAPTNGATGNLFPLSDFGTVDFADCSINGQPISDFDWNQIDMVDAANNAALATTTALGGDGASFSVSAVEAPTTAVSGADASWHKSPVTLTLTVTDDALASGVAYTDYSVDGGAWSQGTSLTIAAPAKHSNDGIHTVRYYSADNDGNVESVKSCRVKIDTLGPVCAAKNVTVKHHRTCRLYFKVHDTRSSEVTNVLAITTKSGHVTKHWSWGYGENYAGWWWISYACRLPRGTYYIRVYGKDLAGNHQSVVGKARLRVT